VNFLRNASDSFVRDGVNVLVGVITVVLTTVFFASGSTIFVVDCVEVVVANVVVVVRVVGLFITIPGFFMVHACVIILDVIVGTSPCDSIKAMGSIVLEKSSSLHSHCSTIE
jgi:hypothetical protein